MSIFQLIISEMSDPMTLKLIQMILATLVGAGTIYIGYLLFLKGIRGKIDFEIGNDKINAKMVNVAPGAIVIMIGALIIYWALNSGASSKEIITTTSNNNIEEKWLDNVKKINKSDYYTDIVFKLFEDDNVKSKMYQLKSDRTLLSLSEEFYNNPKYWQLIALVNRGRGYYNYDSISENTILKTGVFIEYFIASKYNTPNTSKEKFVQVRGNDLNAGYEYLLKYSESREFNDKAFEELNSYFKNEYEFSPVLTTYVVSEDTKWDEISLIYYRNKKYSSLIKWVNKGELEKGILEKNIIPKGNTVLILTFVP
ncbi:hypothetical protein [Kordia sp.]|uniref:hypothetical protein n=1 Tax=Kordia sp. TaxID=1965332 RepID=UPI003D6AB646